MKFKSDNEQDQYLLFKYLAKSFVKASVTVNEAQEQAKNIILDNANNLFGFHGLAWQLGEIDFEFFCLYFLQDTFRPKENNTARELSEKHYEIWDNLQRMFIDDEFDNLELIAPRGFAKTTVVNYALSLWLHCYNRSVYTIVCGRTEQDSTEFVSQTKNALKECKYILDAFGTLIDEKNFTVNKLEIELVNKTKIQAISSTTSMRGKKYNGHRPSVIIADRNSCPRLWKHSYMNWWNKVKA